MIGHQYSGGTVDAVAVRRDDILLDLLGARMVPIPADPAAALLRALTDDVDEVLVHPPVAQDDTTRFRRGRGARGTAITVVVATTLSVSGVAAAVTGDPLSPYRAVLSLGQDDDPPAPRRGAKPDLVRREGTPTRHTGGRVAATDVVMGRAGVGGVQVSGRGPAENAGKPENPGRAADRAKEAKEAKEAKAERLDRADRAGKPVEGSGGAAGPQRARASRPEQKEQPDKP